jgi:hypothetical protein
MKSLSNSGFVISIVFIISFLTIVYFVVSYAPSRLSTEFDDSYMYCRYASNYLSGNGFSWNIGEGAAFGATSPAYLILITTLKSLSQVDNSFLLSLTSFLASLAGLFFLVCAGYLHGETLSKWHFPLLVVPFCLLSDSFRFHSFTGMETTLAFCSNAILIVAVVFYSRKQSRPALVFLFLAAVFTFQVRPDNGVYSLLFPILYLSISGKISFYKAFAFLISFAAAAGVLLLFNSSVFGSPLPIPFYAKSGGFFVGYAGMGTWNAIDYLLLFLKDVAPFAAVVILLGSKKKSLTVASILIPVLITFIYFSTTVQIMGWFARYYFPSIPFFVFAAFLTAEDHLKKSYSFSICNVLWRVFVLLLYFLPIFYSPLRSEITGWWNNTQGENQLYVPETSYTTTAQESLETIPWWDSIQFVSSIVGDLPSGVVIAATEYGYISAENLHAVIVDMAGLNNKELAQSGFSSQRILCRYPDFIWMPHTDYTFFRKELLDDPAFYTNYDYYSGVFNYGVALRRDSFFYDELYASVCKVFQRAYPGKDINDYLAFPIN